MNASLAKLRSDMASLDAERRLMNQALTRLAHQEGRPTTRRGAARLVFGLDLTQSREAGLQRARRATADMFATIKSIGKIAVKLAYYRGNGPCQQSDWFDDSDIVCRLMLELSCESGNTRLFSILQIALGEAQSPSGIVFIGDHCEEDTERLVSLAHELKKKSIPLFVFHECADHDPYSLKAKPLFRQIAEISGGVYVEFKPDSGDVLQEMLSSLAAFSTAGVEGLTMLPIPNSRQIQQMQEHLRLGSGKAG